MYVCIDIDLVLPAHTIEPKTELLFMPKTVVRAAYSTWHSLTLENWFHISWSVVNGRSTVAWPQVARPPSTHLNNSLASY